MPNKITIEFSEDVKNFIGKFGIIGIKEAAERLSSAISQDKIPPNETQNIIDLFSCKHK